MDLYKRKYAKSNNLPSKFDLDITRYKLQQNEINGETSTHIINFVRIDWFAVKYCFILLTGQWFLYLPPRK